METGAEFRLHSGVDGLVRLLWPEKTTHLADVHAQGLVDVQLRLHRRRDLCRQKSVNNAERVGCDAETVEVHDHALSDVDNLPRMFPVAPL